MAESLFIALPDTNIDRKKSMIIETNAAFKTFIRNIVFCVEQILYSDCTLMLML